MTKKHFIALADMIQAHNRCTPPELRFYAVHLTALAEFCRDQNPRFNRERWLGYIAGTNGRNGGKVKVAA